MTYSTKLDFGGGDKPARFHNDLAPPISAGELPDELSRKMKGTVRSGFELPESMTESNPQLDQERQKHNQWLVFIAVYKFVLALMIAAVGVGALRLMHKDIDDVISWLGDLCVSIPSLASSISVLDKASLMNDPMLRRIGAVAFSYAGLSLAEGIGLYLEKAWGEYLTLSLRLHSCPGRFLRSFAGSPGYAWAS